MKNKAFLNWGINLVLWIGFLVAFFLELTGLEIHQWLGLALGALAGYHLALHWKWVQAVGARFFGNTSGQARTYYMIDAAILCGFFLIVGTGVAISTWLNLANIGFLVGLHEASSILTLLLLVVKLGLHWRQIVQAVQKYILAPLAPQPALTPAPAAGRLTRRSFLTLMGIVGVAAGAAITNVQADTTAAAEDAAAGATTAAVLPNSPVAASKTTGSTTTSSTTTGSTTTGSTTTGSTTTGSTTTGSTTATTTTCKLRCNKRCSYPGKCRRYVDTNKNGKCDLGECI